MSTGLVCPKIGDQFGRLTIVGPAPGKRRYWKCLCACGRTKDVRQDHLRTGKIRSCTCLMAEEISRRTKTHGDTVALNGDITPEYRCWVFMIQRCHNPKRKDYQRYGGRGITVCDEWRNDFSAFLSHVGRRPSRKHSLDRIKNELGYQPGNCKWSTTKEQNRNTRSNHTLTIAGKTRCIVEWSEISGVAATTITARVNVYGWTAERAVFEPPKNTGRWPAKPRRAA